MKVSHGLTVNTGTHDDLLSDYLRMILTDGVVYDASTLRRLAVIAMKAA